MTNVIQKKQEIGIVKKQDTLENQVKIVYLGIGSNLGSKVINIEKAKLLLLTNNIEIIKCSKYYETYSWPNKNFPKYLNIVIKIKTKLNLHNLFTLVKSIIVKKVIRELMCHSISDALKGGRAYLPPIF